MNRKLPYTEADIEIINIESPDIITASGDEPFDFGDGGSNSSSDSWTGK